MSSREPVQLEIAGKIVEHCLYVASLQYWMLLGTNFIPNFMVKLPCGNGELHVVNSIMMQLMHKDKIGSVKGCPKTALCPLFDGSYLISNVKGFTRLPY